MSAEDLQDGVSEYFADRQWERDETEQMIKEDVLPARRRLCEHQASDCPHCHGLCDQIANADKLFGNLCDDCAGWASVSLLKDIYKKQ